MGLIGTGKGLVTALGHMCKPSQIPYEEKSQGFAFGPCLPICCLDWAPTGQTGLARSNPTRAPLWLAIWDTLQPIQNPCEDHVGPLLVLNGPARTRANLTTHMQIS